MAKLSHTEVKIDPLLALKPIEAVIMSVVGSDDADLSMRQLGILLAVSHGPGPYTVRGLADTLNIHKPAITRGVDRLQQLDLARRSDDPKDGRSVLISLTPRGTKFLRTIAGVAANPDVKRKPAKPAKRAKAEAASPASV